MTFDIGGVGEVYHRRLNVVIWAQGHPHYIVRSRSSLWQQFHPSISACLLERGETFERFFRASYQLLPKIYLPGLSALPENFCCHEINIIRVRHFYRSINPTALIDSSGGGGQCRIPSCTSQCCPPQENFILCRYIYLFFVTSDQHNNITRAVLHSDSEL